MLEKIEFLDKFKFDNEEIEELIPTVKKLLIEPKTKEFTETLLKGKNLDEMFIVFICLGFIYRKCRII